MTSNENGEIDDGSDKKIDHRSKTSPNNDDATLNSKKAVAECKNPKPVKKEANGNKITGQKEKRKCSTSLAHFEVNYTVRTFILIIF